MRRYRPVDSAARPRRFVWDPRGTYEVLSETSRSPFRRVGGKRYIAKWIIQHFPEHSCYVEPFGGGASVLLQKVPSKIEVYNDVDGHLVEFFDTVKKGPWQVIAILEHMPYSRLMYEGMVRVARRGVYPKDKAERVAMWLYMQCSGFSGSDKAGWGHSKTQSEGRRLIRLSNRLIEVSNRLRGVDLECHDFRKIIETYDGPDTLFYCDPPYIDTEFYYDAKFGMKDHEDLARLLHAVKGKVCLSYGVHPKVDELYAGWRRESKRVLCHSFGITRNTGPKARPMRTEQLLMNY